MLRRSRFVLVFFLATLASSACDDPPIVDGGLMDGGLVDPPPPEIFAALDETGRFVIPELEGHVHVVRTEHDIPHIYASNRLDAWRVLGFIMARDRYFQMDLTSRLSQGLLSELLGDAALATDLENRQTGADFVTQLYLEGLDADEAAELDAYAAGINAYADAVSHRALPPPKELELAFPLLGAVNPSMLMRRWTRRDVAATGASVLYGTSFETGDVGRAAAFDALTFPEDDLREAGLREDIINQYAPPNDSSSADDWGLNTTGSPMAIRDPRRRPVSTSLAHSTVERGALSRLAGRLARVDARIHPAGHEGYGSNSWAVMGSATPDGRALLAGDGHLQLSVPALFWQFGLDTRLLGDADGLRLRGATIAGLPMMGVGTNGRVAWTQTAYFADVTDWYSEVLLLDAEGAPRATMFQGEERPLTQIDETFVIANVPALESIGRTAVIPRWTTFDGRFITSIEGRTVTEDEPLAAGETRVNVMGDWIVPSDQDGDTVISAVSFYYGPFGGGTLLRAFRQFADSDTVEDYRQAMRHFIGYGGSMMAADADGSVLYSAYHAVPCRDYLERDVDNVWVAGADPRRLLDGTRYGAWAIPLDDRGRVDEAQAAAGGDTACAVPFDQWPMALNPTQRFVHHANNDPAHIATDNDLFNDPYYIGGPWLEGYRAARIEQRLEEAIAADDATLTTMQAIQGDHHSNLGEDFASVLLEVIGAARTAAAGTPAVGSAEERMAAQWAANEERYTEVETRITAWRDAGFPTPSGVETFYSTPSATDREHAVATTLFAHWFPRFIQAVLDDEGIDRTLSPAVTGDTFTMQTIDRLVRGRGPTNTLGLGSYDPARDESVYFDDLRTAEVETSQEIGLRALDATFAFLEAAPSEPGVGGFDTDDMSAWIWGLRHQVRFESLLADFLGDDPALAPLLDMFNIATNRLPLASGIVDGDPRFGLRWFPRPGDQFDVDAANPGLDGTTFTHASGPVFRMVIALGPDGVEGQNMLPGGQSGLPGSDFFDDQAQHWLANETTPMRYTPEEVAAGAVSRERYAPN